MATITNTHTEIPTLNIPQFNYFTPQTPEESAFLQEQIELYKMQLNTSLKTYQMQMNNTQKELQFKVETGQYLSYIVYFTFICSLSLVIVPLFLYGFKERKLDKLINNILKDEIAGSTEVERCDEIFGRYLQITTSITGLNLFCKFRKMIYRPKRPKRK